MLKELWKTYIPPKGSDRKSWPWPQKMIKQPHSWFGTAEDGREHGERCHHEECERVSRQMDGWMIATDHYENPICTGEGMGGTTVCCAEKTKTFQSRRESPSRPLPHCLGVPTPHLEYLATRLGHASVESEGRLDSTDASRMGLPTYRVHPTPATENLCVGSLVFRSLEMNE